MPTEKCLRWGILGAGQISHDWAVAVSTLPSTEHKIVAVAARNVANAKEFATKHGIPNVHKSYEDLAKDTEVGKQLVLNSIKIYNISC